MVSGKDRTDGRWVSYKIEPYPWGRLEPWQARANFLFSQAGAIGYDRGTTSHVLVDSPPALGEGWRKWDRQ